jgi:hypothetical protein
LKRWWVFNNSLTDLEAHFIMLAKRTAKKTTTSKASKIITNFKVLKSTEALFRLFYAKSASSGVMKRTDEIKHVMGDDCGRRGGKWI